MFVNTLITKCSIHINTNSPQYTYKYLDNYCAVFYFHRGFLLLNEFKKIWYHANEFVEKSREIPFKLDKLWGSISALSSRFNMRLTKKKNAEARWRSNDDGLYQCAPQSETLHRT